MVELIPRKERRGVLPWQNVLFFIAFAAAAAAAGAYAILYFSVERAALNIKNLEAEIAKRGTIAEKRVEKEVFETEAKINFFAQIFNNHRKPSQFFPKLEAKTHPQAQFNFFDLNLETGVLALRGQTLNFQVLSQQVSAWRMESAMKNIELADLSLGEEGQTDFTALITLDLETLK